MATKKKRPADKSLKTALIQLRVSADQKQAFEEMAAREDLSLSSWLRRAALHEAGLLPLAKG
jgi:uncharacterized protein (DUF1778 family)